jgi:hypothetical protein
MDLLETMPVLDKDIIEMIDFEYAAATILGDLITEASPGANIEMLSFAYKEDYEREFGKLKAEPLNNGLNFIGIGSVIRVNNQNRVYTIPVEAASIDMQKITINLNINMQLKKDMAYNFIKAYKDENMYTTYLNSKVQEKVKSVIFKYKADEIAKILENNMGEYWKKSYYYEVAIEDMKMYNLSYVEILKIIDKE